MRLGDLIKQLEIRPLDQQVRYDFGHMRPTSLASWRGSYSKLALSYSNSGDYSGNNSEITVAQLLDVCRTALGKTFEGWKGGDYVMDEDTEVVVENQGEITQTKLVAVTGDDFYTILLTQWNIGDL